MIVLTVFNAQEIAASGNASSNSIRIGDLEGYFTLQYAVTGDGTCKFEYLLSNDGTNFIEPSDADDIITAQTKTSGPGSDGQDIYSFSPTPAKFMKIKCTETGGADTVTITAYLSMV
jgi:hypothetical protein